MRKRAKKYWEMNAAELAAATREFDREFVGDQARPMNAAERAQEERARRRHLRTARGAQEIRIKVDRRLLEQTDKIAKARGLGRSEFIAEALARAVGRKAS